MRGTSVKTPERVAQAQQMRADGLTLREIGERLGVALNTASSWLSDPDGARLKARKRSYARTCLDCGGPCDGASGAAKIANRCQSCYRTHQHESRSWKQETIVSAIREWADEHGRQPAASDWLPTVPEGVPSVDTVQREFGSWNAAIEAAGFTPFAVGHRPADRTREDYIAAAQRWVAEHGRIPKRDEWAQARDGYPSNGGVDYRFGSWNAFIAAAGYEPRRPGRQKVAA